MYSILSTVISFVKFHSDLGVRYCVPKDGTRTKVKVCILHYCSFFCNMIRFKTFEIEFIGLSCLNVFEIWMPVALAVDSTGLRFYQDATQCNMLIA